MSIRQLPFDLKERAETGALQFKNDHPGYFLRGDDAFQLVSDIEYLLGVIETLASSLGTQPLQMVIDVTSTHLTLRNLCELKDDIKENTITPF